MNKDISKPFQRFWAILKPDQRDIRDIYLFAIVGGILSLGLPLGIQAIINFVQAGKVSTSWFLLVGLVVIAIGFSGFMNIAQLRITENLQQRIFSRSALEFATRIPSIQLKELLTRYAPEWTNRFFDTLTIQKGMSKLLIDFTAASLQIFFGLILLSFYHPFFIIFGFALLLLLIFIFRLTAKRGFVSSLEESKYKYKVANWLEEIARNRISFKFLGQRGILLNRTDSYLQGYLKARETHFKILVQQYKYLIAFKVLIALALLIIGGLLVLSQQMNIGQFVAAEIIIVLVLNSVEKLIVSLEVVYDVLTAIEKIGEVTDLALENKEGLKFDANRANLSVTLQEVSYQTSWSKTLLFEKLNLELEAGNSYLLVDPEGHRGQSLFLLISAITEPRTGAVLINGIPTTNIQVNTLRKHIATCLKQDHLIYGSVFDNLTMGRDISNDEVITLCEQIGLAPLILNLQDEYETILNPEAGALNRSLVSLILIARALLSKPLLFLWDTHYQFITINQQNKVFDYIKSNCNCTVILTATTDQLKEKVAATIFLSEQ
ncbi:MAG: ABC transporter transmembrane domain-containing protein [Flavobacteriales bacterium]